MRVKDPRYDFYITVSAHIIIVDKNKRILMAKRPETWEWAPGRWGLTGGKVYQHESFRNTIRRKTKQELGFVLLPEGLYQVKQLIIKDKQAFMFFFVAKSKGLKLTGKMIDYKWFNAKDLNKLPSNRFAEFFYKKMLTEFLEKDSKLLPINMVESLNYITLGDTTSYKDWFNGIINKNYDPNKIADFRKWKKNNLSSN